MAEITGLRNNALPYPVYGAPFGLVVPIFNDTGALVPSAAGLDTELSKNGDTYTDATNEAAQIATNSGMYYLLLTATEMTADVVAGLVKTSTAKAKTTPFVLYPRKLVTVRSGTAAGGDTGYITLDAAASAEDDYYNGMVCIATIDTVVEARLISDYTGSNKRAAVVPDWNTAPDSDDTFIIKLPDGVQLQQANTTHVSGDSTAADRFEAVLDASPGGVVVDDNDPDPLATAFETDLAEASNDHYNGAFLLFYTGNLTGQSRKISDYDGTSKVVTLATAFTDVPAAGDAFIILGRSE